MDYQGDCFKHISKLFPFKIEAKIKQGIVVGPAIKTQLKVEDLKTKLSPNDFDALNAFVQLVVQTS